MKTFKKRLAVALLTATGLYMGCITEVFAQNRNTNKPSTSRSHTGQHSKKHKSDASTPGTQDNAQAMEESEPINVADDAEFFRRAYEGGLAEVSLGKLAQEKAKSEDVKNYAQELLDQHSTANLAITNFLSSSPSDQMANGNTADSNRGSDTKVGVNSGMGAGTGTVTGSGSGSVGGVRSDSSAIGNTQGNSAGSGVGTTPPNDANSPIGTAGNIDNNRTGVPPTVNNASVDPNATVSSPGMNASSNTAVVSADVRAKQSYILSEELSAEHQAVAARLSKLSGAKFEKEYLREMIKGHDKMWKMVYAKAKEAEGKDDASLTAAQSWARQNVDMIRHHKEKAIQLMNNGSR